MKTSILMMGVAQQTGGGWVQACSLGPHSIVASLAKFTIEDNRLLILGGSQIQIAC